MPRVHVVQQGETIISLSERYGLFAKTIWDDPANAELKTLRQRMDVLMPGDKVVIPDIRPRIEKVAIDQRHVFRLHGIPARFRLVLRRAGRPLAQVDYSLEVAGKTISGRTGDDGLIAAHVPASATVGQLRIGEDPPIVVRFGHMDPLDTLSGVRKRLSNLGLPAPSDDDVESDGWRAAIAALQRRADLPVTGTLDADTRAALGNLHDRLDGGSR